MMNGVKDAAVLALRLVSGGLLAGHGAQKLFGWFGGGGPLGTAGMMERMGIRPSERWALIAGGSEFGGGLLTALGLAWPLGPVATMAPMAIATGRAHWGRPIWASKGGAELPVTNLALAGALAAAGPGRLSLDRLLRIRLGWPLTALALGATAAGVAYVLSIPRPAPPAAPAPTPAGPESTHPPSAG